MLMIHVDVAGFRGYRLTAERGDSDDSLITARDALWTSGLVWMMGPEIVDDEETILIFLNQVATPDVAVATIINRLRAYCVFVS